MINGVLDHTNPTYSKYYHLMRIKNDNGVLRVYLSLHYRQHVLQQSIGMECRSENNEKENIDNKTFYLFR